MTDPTHERTPQEHPPQALFATRDLSVRYGTHLALHGATVQVRPGERVAVIGPNGAGKSTLLRALLGLLPVSSGTLDFHPRHAARPRDMMAYVPQQQTLDWTFPVTVWDVAMMGRTGRLGWLRRPGARDRAIVQQALEATGTADLARRPIGDLSGGQRQRALLARMLARQADLLLLDEPLTGVDAATGTRILELLRAQGDAGRGVLMVTHDLEGAAQWADWLVLVNRRVIAQGRPEDVYTPQNVEATFTTSHLGHTHAQA